MTPAEQLFAPLFHCIQGGEQHQRIPLVLEADTPFRPYLEIAYALRSCLEQRARHDYLVQRLRPHVDVMIGTLPPGLQAHGLLPHGAPPAEFRPLEQISDAALRAWLIEDGGMIYGELQQEELARYFAAISPFVAPGGVMVDLGSGLGKVVMSAALSLPFRRCIGVELLGYRHKLAVQRSGHLLALARQELARLSQQQPLSATAALPLPSGVHSTLSHLIELPSRIAFIEADMFRVEVRGASLVFLYSTCFGPLMAALAHKLAGELQPGALVSTTTYPLQHPAFRLLQHFPAGTLAWTSVHLYQRFGDWDGAPVAVPPSAYLPDPVAWEARLRAELAARAS